MKLNQFISFGLLIVVFLGCKPMMESNTSTASKNKASESQTCQLSESQLKLFTSAQEYKSLENVKVESLPENERKLLSQKNSNRTCTTVEISSLGEDFPSIAAKFPGAGATDASATALALGDSMMGTPGVVRTEYIRMPTGSRYIAGYNSDGTMILLQRLLMRRP